MHYRKWDEDDAQGIQSISGMVVLYTELDNDGNVRREIGFNKSDEVVHRFPSRLYRYGTYGLFDNQKVVIIDGYSNVTKDEFEKLWGLPDQVHPK